MTTDGPFTESKEHLGGFYIIRADDLNAALALAAKVTAAIDTPIEVRPFAATDLYALTPTPVVALNRAIAIGETHGSATVVALIDRLELGWASTTLSTPPEPTCYGA